MTATPQRMQIQIQNTHSTPAVTTISIATTIKTAVTETETGTETYTSTRILNVVIPYHYKT